MITLLDIGKHTLSISGRLVRVARLRDEYYDFIESPTEFIANVKSSARLPASLFTFVPPISPRATAFNFHVEMDSAAMLNISTYEDWWKKQINDKTRNMVRKATKSGVEIRVAELTDDFIQGIGRIYNGDFKKHHGFVRMELPRYYVPLDLKGMILLKCSLHRSLVDRIPEAWLDRLAVLREGGIPRDMVTTNLAGQ